MVKHNPRSGSHFDDFLKEEGIYEETNAAAIKRILARQLMEIMREQNVSKVEMAKRLNTSRTQLNRLLDPENDRVQLNTLQHAANVLGHQLRVELVENHAA